MAREVGLVTDNSIPQLATPIKGSLPFIVITKSQLIVASLKRKAAAIEPSIDDDEDSPDGLGSISL